MDGINATLFATPAYYVIGQANLLLTTNAVSRVQSTALILFTNCQLHSVQ